MELAAKPQNDYSLKNYRILGYTTDFNQCECCGKEGLKGTVSILDLNSDVVLHFGSTCASNANKYDSLEAAKKAKREISKVVNEHMELMKIAATIAHKTLKELRLNKSLTLDNCTEDKEYLDAWTTARDGNYKVNRDARAKLQAEFDRRASRTPDQVIAEEKADAQKWAKWREDNNFN